MTDLDNEEIVNPGNISFNSAHPPETLLLCYS